MSEKALSSACFLLGAMFMAECTAYNKENKNKKEL